METPQPPPRNTPPGIDDLVQAQAWLALKDELQVLHARLEYLRLILRLEARRS